MIPIDFLWESPYFILDVNFGETNKLPIRRCDGITSDIP